MNKEKLIKLTKGKVSGFVEKTRKKKEVKMNDNLQTFLLNRRIKKYTFVGISIVLTIFLVIVLFG